MPVLDHIIGDVQIQERRPKSWNEPRRKRLSFVRPRNQHSRQSSSSSNPDEWALVPRPGNARHYRNDAETWDLRRFEAQQRFNEASMRQRDLEHRQRIHFTHQLYGPPPNLQQIHDQGRRQGMLEDHIQEIRPRDRHDSDDDIIQVVSGSDFDDDDDDFDDHHGHGRRPRREMLSIEQDRDRGRAIHNLTDRRRSKSKSKGKKGKKGKKSNKRDDSDSDSDDDRDKAFVQGVKAGITLSRERGGHGGGSDRGSPRARRRFLRDDDSDDSMNFRPRRRSRSGGRPPWWGM